MSTVALIPARGGSERIKRKNVRPLGKHPLLAYTISTALQSGVFDKVLVSSDDLVTLGLAQTYGADALRRPDEFATSTSPDIDWVRHALFTLGKQGDTFTDYSILRPTSPFRSVDLIQAAHLEWLTAKDSGFTSLRAVEPVGQHPGKMWQVQASGQITPLLLQPAHAYHDSQKAALPKLWVQNACIEFSTPETVVSMGSISGDNVYGFKMESTDSEGFDLNTLADWEAAEMLLEVGEATLPEVK